MAEPDFDDRFLNNLPDYVTATPVDGDPFEHAAQRVRAPYEKANQRDNPVPFILGALPGYIKDKIVSGVTAPLDALTGKLQVNDPETNMPTQEAIGRSMDVAGLAGSGGIGGAESGSVLGSGPFKQGWESAGLKEKPASWDRVKPAIRDPETGELFVGSRRDTHEHVLARQYEKETGEISGEDRESINKLYNWDKKRKFEDGYYDFKDQKFHNRSDPNSEYYGVDSTSFNPRKAMRADQVWSSGLPVTFTPVDGDPHKSANTVGDAIDTAAKKYGINPTVLKGIASIESSWDPGSNRNKATQYKGLFQIGKEEWKQHGSGDIYNAKDNANAAAKMLSEHAQWFKDNYGREPTPGEFYMMHQQGRGFISNGTMTNIGGNPYPGMRGPQTPETFKQGWSDTLARKMAQFGGADSISDGTERPPSSNVKVASNSPTPTHKFTPVDFNPFDLVNHANHVPYGAGASDTPSGYPVNIDKRIPQHNDELKLPDGEPADLHKYLTIHEIEEYKAMKNGVPYHTAHHDIATPMEKKAVESDGVDWKKYTHIMDGYLKKTEEEGYKNLPKGLYAKPYHSRSLIKPEPKKEDKA